MRLPTGISVEQAKKDAKKLAKETEQTLAEAQDVVAKKNCRSSWPVMMNMLNNHSQLTVTLNRRLLTKDVIKFPLPKSLTTVVGMTGSGKTLLLLEFAAQWLKLGIPVVYIGLSDEQLNSETPAWMLDLRAVSMLKKKYGNLFRDYGWNVNPVDLTLDGAVLILEEPSLLLEKNEPHKYRALINASLHTFIGCQEIDGARPLISGLKNISDDNLHYIVLPIRECVWESMTQFDQRLAEVVLFQDKLIQKTNEFTEFLSINKDGVRRFKFELKDHSAFANALS